jgi:hypothetical protein
MTLAKMKFNFSTGAAFKSSDKGATFGQKIILISY